MQSYGRSFTQSERSVCCNSAAFKAKAPFGYSFSLLQEIPLLIAVKSELTIHGNDPEYWQ